MDQVRPVNIYVDGAKFGATDAEIEAVVIRVLEKVAQSVEKRAAGADAVHMDQQETDIGVNAAQLATTEIEDTVMRVWERVATYASQPAAGATRGLNVPVAGSSQRVVIGYGSYYAPRTTHPPPEEP